jgi:DNA polymerase-4
VSEEAAILHADVDAFFASVEQRDDPRLRGRPTIVGSGVVMAASYEARAYGVRGAMSGGRARRLCPHAVVLDPRWSAYVQASKALFEVFHRMSPLVVGLSMEEAFLDVRGLRRILGSPTEIAVRLRREVRGQVGLPITVGVGRSKVIAKMASRSAKPDGLLVVPPGGELAFLHPIPVERVWGVGPSTAKKLHGRGIRTVGDVARHSEETLVSILGPASARRLHALAHNREFRPLRAGGRRRSFGSQSALGRSSAIPEALGGIVATLVDRVTRRMRASGWVGRTVAVRMRFDDFSRATRSRTMPQATAATRTILRVARALLAASVPEIDRRGLTLVGVTVANLERAGRGVQLTLPLEAAESALDASLDEIRDRFGADAVTRGAMLGRGPRLSARLLAGDQPASSTEALISRAEPSPPPPRPAGRSGGPASGSGPFPRRRRS